MKYVLYLIFPILAFAGSNPKTIQAVRTHKAPQIDGVLNEAEWQAAPAVSDLLQAQPNEGAEPTERTYVRILFDDEALYIGCLMQDSRPEEIVARLARRDDEVESDGISIRFDTFHDHQSNYEFTLNAAGVKTDILQYDDGRSEDKAWNAVWEAETQITSDGWTAEIKIPFKALRYPEELHQDWGVQFYRWISRKQERQHWALIRKRESGITSHFGHLVGVEAPPASGGLEVLPYAVGSAKFLQATSEFHDGREYVGSVGGNIKYRPSSGLTVDAAINPDFGQVEADPAVLNVSTFETFYPEQRPFFIEGSQIFQFNTFDGGSGLFYSRRIGRPLNVEEPEGGSILQKPHFATILGAVKVSGKTTDGLSIGVLDAVTRREDARFSDSLGRSYNQTIEPLANYSLMRLRQDFWDNSSVGMILTSVNRADRAPAFTGGTDWNIKFRNNLYRIDGFWAFSQANPAGSALGGSAGRMNFRKEGGDHWRGLLSVDYTSREFYINDMGYFRRPNDFGGSFQLQYREDIPATWYQQWQSGFNLRTRHNFDGAEIGRGLAVFGSLTLSSYWVLEMEVEIDRAQYDDRETRGNGWYNKPGTQEISLEISSDRRKPVVGKLQFRSGSDTRNSTNFRIEGGVELKPATNISLNLELEYSDAQRKHAWVAHVDDPAVSLRTTNIFAERSTKEWNLTARGSFIFTHDLTLEVYSQAFIAEQLFERYERMISPNIFLPYSGYSKPGGTEIVFHSNVVLRWEYLPGSTFYIVWSHARADEREWLTSSLSNNLSHFLSIPGENVLMLKLSYWMSY